jgi:poly(3-hydroxybutyrate) depolymerase
MCRWNSVRAALSGVACGLLVACGSSTNSNQAGSDQAGAVASGSGAAAVVAGSSAQPSAAGSGEAGSPVATNGGAAGKAGAATKAGTGAADGGGGGTLGTGDVPAVAFAGSGGMLAAGSAGMPAEPACDKVIPPSTDCSAKLAPGDERTCMLGNRKYIVHAGKTMNPCQPVGLVIDAHGATETAEQQLGTEKFCAGQNLCWEGLGSGWAAESDMPGGGFIAVFPQGNNNMWSASDATFMLNIVEEMKKLADIDPAKVYISGISNGGFLTFQTGCPHSDVFRGMSPNSGGSTCDSVKQPIPLISFDAEPDFAYDGHKSANMSVVTANKCKGEAKPWLTIDGSYTEAVCRTANQDPKAKLVPCTEVSSMVKPTICKIWDECDGGVKVAWCDVSPNTEHGDSNAATDAHILYVNSSLLNTPSVAWRFFKSFWH